MSATTCRRSKRLHNIVQLGGHSPLIHLQAFYNSKCWHEVASCRSADYSLTSELCHSWTRTDLGTVPCSHNHFQKSVNLCYQICRWTALWFGTVGKQKCISMGSLQPGFSGGDVCMEVLEFQFWRNFDSANLSGAERLTQSKIVWCTIQFCITPLCLMKKTKTAFIFISLCHKWT